MNRRGFLKNMGLATSAVAVAPLEVIVPASKRMIYKVDLPVFMVWYYNNLTQKTESRAMAVSTYTGTLKEFCEIHPNKEIFFYQEGQIKMSDDMPETNFVRAVTWEPEPNIKILVTKNYEV